MSRARIALFAALTLAGAAQSQSSFPTKPVRMIVAFTAGSETDYFARIVGQKLADQWGHKW